MQTESIDTTMKYIKVLASSVRVKIERGGDATIKHFKIRDHKDLSETISAAIEWRNHTHKELFGVDVKSRIVQVKKRVRRQIELDPVTNLPLPTLPTGLCYGIHGGRLMYVVASYQQNGKPVRERVAIKDKDIESAIEKATKIRMDRISS